jgi:hypothetical protein
MSRVAALPNWADIKGRVLVDIMNEPDSMHMRWEASDHYPGVRELYLETMDSLHDLSHDGWLYVVQGTGQNAFGLNWGNGFVSDYNIIRCDSGVGTTKARVRCVQERTLVLVPNPRKHACRMRMLQQVRPQRSQLFLPAAAGQAICTPCHHLPTRVSAVHYKVCFPW